MNIAVIGGGIIGLAVAREVMEQRQGAEVVVYEKESEVAAHQTGRNSGVVHAGLYYEPGGLKAKLCRRGVELLHQFASDKGIAYNECGKIVVAKNELQRSRLNSIYERATANKVPNVRLIGPQQIQGIEPHVVGLAALHSPSTAIVDFKGVARALAEDIVDAGGELRLATKVIRLDDQATNTGRPGVTVLSRSHGAIANTAEKFDLVIACAGLQSDRLAKTVNESAYPKIVPFYGDYFFLSHEKAGMVNGLIYPVPDPRFPFLGVHITRRYDGEVMLGPNAFLSLGREMYRRVGLNVRDLADVASAPGFWRFASKNIPAVFRETRTASSKRVFVNEANQYMPGIQAHEVRRGPRGIRAQAMHADGSLADDFVITGTRRLVMVRNAPSPGATSALAIAEHVVNEALSRGNDRNYP